MKKITLLFLLIVNTLFSQNTSSPKPILSYFTDFNTWEILDSNMEIDCGNTNFQIKATWTSVGSSDTYRIEAIPYNPKPYARDSNFDGTIDTNDFLHGEMEISQGDVLNTSVDDQWSQIFNLKTHNVDFNFCFFGNQRNQFVLSSNGIVSFNTTYTGGHSAWDIQNMGKISPSANLGDNKESILLMTDTYANDSSALSDTYSFWNIQGGIGERYFVLGYYHMPLYNTDAGCGNAYGYATYQMVFYETTNIIEYHIQDKPICDAWPANQYMAMGIQNLDQTVGFAAPGRDNLDAYQILDLTDGFYDGNTNPSYPVSPPESWRFIPDGSLGTAPVFTWYTNYDHTNNTGTFVSNNPELTINAYNIPNAGTIYTAQIAYVNSCSGETYYAIQDVNITVQAPIPAPVGDTPQYLNTFSTLNDIVVENTAGFQNIYWFDNAVCSGSPLTNTTTLVEGNTYYAYQGFGTNECCPESLAVTIYLSDDSVNYINGTLKYDMNNDGCDANDISVSQYKVISTNGTNTYITFSNNSGIYTQNIPNDLGDYTTTVVAPNYLDVTPNSQANTFINYSTTFVADFCVTSNQAVNNVDISIVSIQSARPGFIARYKIVYKNTGTTQLNGNISFTFNGSKMQFLSASETTNSQMANSLSFNYNTLNPFEERNIDLEFQILEPPTTNIGDILHFTAAIGPTTNSFNMEQTVIGSFDPNDITCLEGDEILLENTDKYLHYIIRFQNTGTASAINITVENQLDTKLDWNTLEIVSYSHENRISMKNGKIDFVFNAINLPNSSADEPNSHGYVAYKIKPKSNVNVGDIISNNANIYFDFNTPIATNTANTEIVNTLGLAHNTLLDFYLYPSPTKNILKVNSKTTIQSIQIYTKLGQLVLSNNNQNKIDTATLNNGIYFCKVTDNNGHSAIENFIKK